MVRKTAKQTDRQEMIRASTVDSRYEGLLQGNVARGLSKDAGNVRLTIAMPDPMDILAPSRPIRQAYPGKKPQSIPAANGPNLANS